MQVQTFQNLISRHKNKIEQLKRKGILLLANIATGLIDDHNWINDNSRYFDDENTLQDLLYSDYLDNYNQPVLLHFGEMISFYRKTTGTMQEKIASALAISRINFMGTDGIRGKIHLEPSENFIRDFVVDNKLSPSMVKACAYGFCRLLMQQNILKANDFIVFGNDGRDRATGNKLCQAIIEGISAAKIRILDLGIIPTAFVPQQLLQNDYRAGIMLTASHNPANQNGIKFFVDGNKLLPEGVLGDFALTSSIYRHKNFDIDKQDTPIIIRKEIDTQAAQFILDYLPDNIQDILQNTLVLLDHANGAFSEIANLVLEKATCRYQIIQQEVADGHNINKNCGVAELEGKEKFEADQRNIAPLFIRELFVAGRKNPAGKVFGLSLDGDGDRGFVAYYHKAQDCVYILDGDKCGFILALYFNQNKTVKRNTLVSTIESDLMLSSAAEQIGLKNAVVSVGDKWIGHFDRGNMLLGLEVSGHIILPLEFRCDNGNQRILRSGIGLLSCLLSLAAIKELDLDHAKIIHPFSPGFAKTWYSFFIDKSLFFHDSKVWREDVKILQKEITALIEAEKLDPSTRLIIEAKEDNNVLYAKLVDKNGLLGCVFTRNSGTEDKNAVYAQGKSELHKILSAPAIAIQKHHMMALKNKKRIEYQCQQEIIGLLAHGPQKNIEQMKTIIEQKMQRQFSENDFYSIVYALKKENLLIIGDKIEKL